MKTKYRYLLIAVFVFMFIFAILQLESVSKTAASIAASVYVNAHYAEQGFSLSGVEYEPHFGQYIVTFRNHNEQLHLMMYPNSLPVFVQHDPFNSGK